MAQFLSLNQFYGFFLVTDCKEKEVPFCIEKKSLFFANKNLQRHTFPSNHFWMEGIEFQKLKCKQTADVWCKQSLSIKCRTHLTFLNSISLQWLLRPLHNNTLFWLYYNGTLNFFLSWNIPFWFWLTTRLTFFTNSHIKSL